MPLPRLANLPFVWHIASFRKSCCGKDKGILLMQIWPAIDLRGGKCVRLRQGDYRQETVYGEDPAAMAQPVGGRRCAATASGRPRGSP